MKKKSSENFDADTSIRVLNINKKRFVVGLQWRVVKQQRNVMKEIKRIGKRDKLDVVAIRHSDAIQAGFAPKSNLKLRGCYSLVVALATILEGCCIAVIPVGEVNGKKEFTLVGRTEKGGIHPYSDVIYSEDDIAQYVIDLKSELKGSKSDLEVKVYGDTENYLWATDNLDLENFLAPKNIKKDFKLKPLTWGMTRKQIVILAFCLVLISIVLIILSDRNESMERIKQQQLILSNQHREDLNREARYKVALSKVSHPWVEQPSVLNFIKGCDAMLPKIRPSIKGWIPTAAKCTATNIEISYARQAGSAVTVKDFVDGVRDEFGVEANVKLIDTSILNFSLPIEMTPDGDDPLQGSNEQEIKLVSLFQSLNINSSLAEIPIIDVKENELHEVLPLQDWQGYKFEYESDIPTRMIFKETEWVGVRLSSIVISIDNDSGAFKYKVEGKFYAKRKNCSDSDGVVTCQLSNNG